MMSRNSELQCTVLCELKLNCDPGVYHNTYTNGSGYRKRDGCNWGDERGRGWKELFSVNCMFLIVINVNKYKIKLIYFL